METRRKLTGPVLEVAPDKVIAHATGLWGCAILGAAVTHRVFTILERGSRTPEELAREAGLSVRGAQTLLDGIVGLGLAEVAGGRYRPSREAVTYLCEGRPSYLGEWVKLEALCMEQWQGLPDAVRAGAPPPAPPSDTRFWEALVPALIPIGVPVAQAAADALEVSRRGPISILDVGGGSGIYSLTMLRANPRAVAVQIDWPAVNRIAREHLAREGFGDRFATVDSDFHEVELGEGMHDLAIYASVAHIESPEANRAMFARIHRTLTMGGALVVADFMVDDDRSGPPMALLFASNMLLRTTGGTCYRRRDYEVWLREAGFRSVVFKETPIPISLAIATR
jgi:ubiquinone/menaquinone biosynthesis C-methylase UbiE